MIALASSVIFYGLILILVIFSITMIYVLLRFGQSKTLGLGVTVLYFILMSSLFTAAQSGFNNLPFLK